MENELMELDRVAQILEPVWRVRSEVSKPELLQAVSDALEVIYDAFWKAWTPEIEEHERVLRERQKS